MIKQLMHVQFSLKFITAKDGSIEKWSIADVYIGQKHRVVMLDNEFSLKAFEHQRFVADDGDGRKESSRQEDDDQAPKDPQSAGLVLVNHSGESVSRRRPSKSFPEPNILVATHLAMLMMECFKRRTTFPVAFAFAANLNILGRIDRYTKAIVLTRLLTAALDGSNGPFKVDLNHTLVWLLL